VILYSHLGSPNNSKKISYYLVTDFHGIAHKVLPGEKIMLARNSKIGDLPTTLSRVGIDLIYENGLYQNFYDKDEEFVSQATGSLLIKPTALLQVMLFFGAWVFVIAALLLVKQTVMSSSDLKEMLVYLKRE